MEGTSAHSSRLADIVDTAGGGQLLGAVDDLEHTLALVLPPSSSICILTLADGAWVSRTDVIANSRG